ncbi:amidohydrolase family protein [Limnoglobus roseus]|uniref:Amidohydrolase n=1 Tax=Limnoglobus roseus TaxID=2598579 RepID=A0A5C1AJ05_9BACT|nr:amidohydrolase family protein [Limnoglobus roseus]QEL17094.1 amidohydrolase [Limnoglobus roseus]
MIDAHIHVVPPQIPGAGSLAPILRSPAERVAAVVRQEMQNAGMTRAFAMGEWRITADDPLGINRTLMVADKVPGLSAIGIMDPMKDKDDHEHFRRVREVMAAGRVVALKAYLGYLHYNPSHLTYRRYYEIAEQYDVPVFFHTGDTYSPYAKLKYAHPLGVDDVAVDHPQVRFVMAHLGNPWTVDAAEVIYKNVNVWADLSGLVVGEAEDLIYDEVHEDLADVIDRVHKAIRYCGRPNRFLYGTDWPLVPMAAYRDFIAAMVPAEMHELVFRENAERLFRVK